MMDTFEKTVIKTVEKEKTDVLAEMENEYKNNLESAVQSATQAANDRLFSERYKIELINNKRTAQALNHAKKTLIEIRNALTKKLFNEIKNDLVAFVGSPAYPLFFQKKITAHRTGIFTHIVVMERDIGLVPPESGITIETTGYDFIGGFKLTAQDHSVLADYTLLSAWLEQHGNFSALYNETLKNPISNG
jgi:vacuolar-type H+-ATPase subunit E/Vma4